MPSYNWREFTRRVPVQAPAKAVYEAWTTQQGLENWFLRKAIFIRPDGSVRSKDSRVEAGDHYTWYWHGHDDSACEERQILQANGWDQLQFSFSGGCIVTVTVKQEQGQTLCELKQEMTMEDENERIYFFIECGSGWSFYLVNLKSVLEGGLDLRNKNVNLREVITA